MLGLWGSESAVVVRVDRHSGTGYQEPVMWITPNCWHVLSFPCAPNLSNSHFMESASDISMKVWSGHGTRL